MARMTFGQMFRELRSRNRIPLRRFCLSGGFDPEVVSKIERDEVVPPQRLDVLARYARALKVERGSPEWQEFFALAKRATGRSRRLSRAELLDRLPVVFRTKEGQKVSSQALDHLIKKIASS